MVEFTGERVVPGQVGQDLWNEHFARYAFARRLARDKRVLDAGCGTGYGAAELAQSAATVIGIDLSPAAASFAASTYPLQNLAFAAASCTQLPFPAAAFDLIVAFEVIEHLSDYRAFLGEAARTLTPTGHCLISTPNIRYYAESRAQSGPNPYHEHEFDAEEFYQELRKAFPHVTLLLQNRVEAFAFHPVKTFWPAEARIDGGGGDVQDAHFYLAVCSHSPLPDLKAFTYVPKAANLLREREQHVKLLETQLDQSKHWLAETRSERDQLLELFHNQKSELEAHNRWAQGLNQSLAEAHTRIDSLQQELALEQAAAAEVATGYESKVRQLEAENAVKTAWALDTETRLGAELSHYQQELARCSDLLQATESTVEERTLWAQRAEAERSRLTDQLNAASASRWLRVGRRLGVGPSLTQP